MERSHMGRTKLNFGKFDWATFPELAAVAILLTGCFPTKSIAQQQGQKTFSSPDEASNAFANAAQNNDEKEMLNLLGPDEKQIVSSGDETEDAQNRANFVAKYQKMHRLVKENLFRRIGRNEISTIRVCQELVAAENDYHSAEHVEYAQKIFSDEGQHNGLYW